MSVKTGAKLSYRLYQTGSGRDRYRSEMLRLLQGDWNEEALLVECDRLEELLDPHLGPTQRRMTDRLDELREFVEGRREIVLAEIEDGMPRWDKAPRKPIVFGVGGRSRTVWDAVRNGDVDSLARRLRRGGSVNMVSEGSGSSLLGLAAVAGQLDVAEFLLAEGASLNLASNDLNTPLHGAAMFGRVEIVKLLLEAGADLAAKNAAGATPLAAATGEWDAELEGLLKSFAGRLKLKADLDEVRANRPKAAALLRRQGARSGK